MFRSLNNHAGQSARSYNYPSKHDNLNIALTKSVSLDDDEEYDSTTTNDLTESFLESYEVMLRHQKDEMAVTLRHLEPLLELLERKSPSGHSKGNHITNFTKEFTYDSLKQALDEIEADDSLRFVASDLQWKLVLEILTENEMPSDENISWAEIVMCYRTCILGMQTLDQTPEPNALRARVRQRSIQMLSSFRPNKLEKQFNKTLPESKKTAIEWVDAMFIGGSIVLVATIMLFLVQGTAPNSPALESTNDPRLYDTPLIQETHVMTFMESNLMIPGPVLSPYAADTLMIPGPKVAPFYVEKSTSGSIHIPDTQLGTPTFSVLPTKQESSRNSRKRLSKSLIIGPLDSNKEKEPRNLESKIRKSDSLENHRTARRELAVSTIAGGVVASIIAPMTTSLIGKLGSTLPGIFSIGATVIVSTLIAHGIREIFASVLCKLRKAWRS